MDIEDTHFYSIMTIKKTLITGYDINFIYDLKSFNNPFYHYNNKRGRV